MYIVYEKEKKERERNIERMSRKKIRGPTKKDDKFRKRKQIKLAGGGGLTCAKQYEKNKLKKQCETTTQVRVSDRGNCIILAGIISKKEGL